MLTDDQLCALDCMLLLEAERRYWLARCMRLEQQIIDLKHERDMAWQTRPHIKRPATPAQIDALRDMAMRGVPKRAIAKRTGWSYSTVCRYVGDVLRERAVGE